LNNNKAIKGNKVIINNNRILEVNDRPFFPIGARHMPLGGTIELLNQTGFNCMRWMVFGADANERIQMCLPPNDMEEMLFYPYVYNKADFSEDKEKKTRQLKELIEYVRFHKAMLCYEQRNEPAWNFGDFSRYKSAPEGLLEGSNFIRELDPDHPIRIGHGNCNLISTLKRYNEAVDIVGCNPYIVNPPGLRVNVSSRFDGKAVDSPNQTLSAVGDYTTKMMRVAGGKAVWMQLQAMANEDWYNEHYTPWNRGEGAYEYQRLYPSAWQMRFMAFNAIVRGATALEWAMYKLPVCSNAWNDVCKVIGELNGLQEILTSPTCMCELMIEYIELGFSDWTGIEVMVKIFNGKPWIFAVNTQFDPAEAKFYSLPEGIGNYLEVYGENREVGIEGGCFTDRFQPYEVHIYKSC